jgi:hypothetical protein
MLKLKKLSVKLILLAIIGISLSCNSGFLDIQFNKKLVIPKTLDDYQSLLDNSTTMNSNRSFFLGLVSSDEFITTDVIYNTLTSQVEKNLYIWKSGDVYENEQVLDWNGAYKSILYANLAIEGLLALEDEIKLTSSWREAYGSAHFYRGSAFFYLTNSFGEQYVKETSNQKLGIPLRLKSDIEVGVQRSTVSECYDQVERDLKLSLNYLSNQAITPFRPSKAASYAMLSRMYLQKNEFHTSYNYADSSLRILDDLIDYNTLILTNTYPFSRDIATNKEVIFAEVVRSPNVMNEVNGNIANELYELYDNHDIRKRAYFNTNKMGGYYFRGSYTGGDVLFAGITVAEVLLIKAETAARLEDFQSSLASINLLRINRFESGYFVPFQFQNKDHLIEEILLERRRELIYRGLRWYDLKRLNVSQEYSKDMSREINGAMYYLNAKDKRYVFPIPADAVFLGGIPQNDR